MVAPEGISPTNVAPVRLTELAKRKSSAASISILDPFCGREAIAMSPSGLPVLKRTTGCALTGVSGARLAAITATPIETAFTFDLPGNRPRLSRTYVRVQPECCRGGMDSPLLGPDE